MFLKRNVYKLFLILLLVPLKLCAYSDYIIASGENIGIKLNSNGIIIVGTYEIDDKNPSIDAGLQVGDIITSINDTNITTISEMVNLINSSDSNTIKVGFLRDNKEKSTNLELYDDNGTYKTGLYVKDSITGIGTLTFIDPETRLFGALGHEIIESNTGKILDITDGEIFDSKVTGITPSSDGEPGEKNATFNSSDIDGKIKENTNKGIFGNYTSSINNLKKYKVAKLDDIKLGEAKILTVLDGEKIGEYSINIIKVSNTKDKVKNIVFEITDNDLLKKTNGIIQGMSGSPIIQGEYIIGAVTHVVVDNPHKGYGIVITNMLEEAEN